MYAITGITGQVGSAVAETLIAQGLTVRAVVRDTEKAKRWESRGCEIGVADVNDVAALTNAFQGVDGVFVLLPPIFDPSPGFIEGNAMLASLHAALKITRPPRIVCLSTIGAQASQPNLLNLLGMMEASLAELPSPVTFLRAAWFMENALWDVPAAREEGVLRSFLQPLDKAFPMVATGDIGKLAAELLQETWAGSRIVELEGPQRVSPNQLAAAFARVLGHPVKAAVVPRDSWIDLFTSQGMKNPTPRAQMIDGFNQGWIRFESDDADVRKGNTALDTVIAQLVMRS
ncbi:NmrA family NAD(P)-binding protein [Rhodanobacter sp. BL-MT-08]